MRCRACGDHCTGACRDRALASSDEEIHAVVSFPELDDAIAEAMRQVGDGGVVSVHAEGLRTRRGARMYLRSACAVGRSPRVMMHRRLDDGPLEPCEYRVVEREMGEHAVVIACPCCGGEAELVDHTVEPSGEVTPIWMCDAESCPAMEFLLLNDGAEP